VLIGRLNHATADPDLDIMRDDPRVPSMVAASRDRPF
jgi:hypothetical protein